MSAIVLLWVTFMSSQIENLAHLPIQVELATGRFPYAHWSTPFEQLKQVVNDDSPQLPKDTFSEEFEDFIVQW